MEFLRRKLNDTNIFFICLSVFILSILCGFLISEVYPHKPSVKELNPAFWGIFFQNIKVSLMLISFGVFTLGFSTLLLLINNGVSLGIALKSLSFDWAYILYLLPHGIIEIPAILLSAILGIQLICNLILESGKYKLSFFLKRLLIIFLCFFIAACIETYITPVLCSNFL